MVKRQKNTRCSFSLQRVLSNSVKGHVVLVTPRRFELTKTKRKKALMRDLAALTHF